MGGTGFAVLGAVFLVVTGFEALYADMGHFASGRSAWPGSRWCCRAVAQLLRTGRADPVGIRPASNIRSSCSAPGWALVPLVLLATRRRDHRLAGADLRRVLVDPAGIQLGYAPRLDIQHPSYHEMGQVYVPQVNWALMVSTIAIVIGFGSSTALAAAYGIAVTLTMVITALLLHVVAIERWGWPPWVAHLVTGLFLIIDLAFFGANALKIAHGGWLPLVIGGLLFTLLTTWKTGRQIVAKRLTARAVPIEEFLAGVAKTRPARVAGTAVFMTAAPRGTPPALAHNVRYNKVLHEHVVTLMISTTVPHVPPEEQVTVKALGHGCSTCA